MNIKVMQLSDLFKEIMEDDVDCFMLDEKEYYNKHKRSPVFNRDGIYLHGDECWMEYKGKACWYDKELFKFQLEIELTPGLRDVEFLLLYQLKIHKMLTDKLKHIFEMECHRREIRGIRHEYYKKDLWNMINGKP